MMPPKTLSLNLMIVAEVAKMDEWMDGWILILQITNKLWDWDLGN